MPLGHLPQLMLFFGFLLSNFEVIPELYHRLNDILVEEGVSRLHPKCHRDAIFSPKVIIREEIAHFYFALDLNDIVMAPEVAKFIDDALSLPRIFIHLSAHFPGVELLSFLARKE